MSASDKYTASFPALVDRYSPTVETRGLTVHYWTRADGVFTPKGFNNVELISQFDGMLHCIAVKREGSPDWITRPLTLAMLQMILEAVHHENTNPTTAAAIVLHVATKYLNLAAN